MSKSLSSSQGNPADPQPVVAGESRELGRATARAVEARDVVVAEAVAAQIEDMEGDMEEDMGEAVAGEVQPWPMASTFQTSPGLSWTRNGPLSQVRTGAISMKNESAGAHQKKALLGKAVQLRLLLPLPTDRPSPSTTLRRTSIIEELAALLALAAVPIVVGDVEDEEALVIDLTLLDADN